MTGPRALRAAPAPIRAIEPPRCPRGGFFMMRRLAGSVHGIAMAFDFRRRARAFLAHLGGSLVLALGALGLVYGVWYPAPLAQAVGVSAIVLLMLAVDVVLGPALTFAVYQVGKKSLRLDLMVIVAVQLAAFAYGLHAIAQGRPAWLVFNADRFDVAQVSELDLRYQADARPPYRAPSWTGPRWVASVNPDDPQKRNQLVLESAGGGSDLPQRIDLYRPLESEAERMRAKARPLGELQQFNAAPAVAAVLARWPQADAWLPLMSRAQPMVVLLDREQARPLAIVDLRPWA